MILLGARSSILPNRVRLTPEAACCDALGLAGRGVATGVATGAEAGSESGLMGCRVATAVTSVAADAVGLESAALGSPHPVSDSASAAPAAHINLDKSAPS
jgi:hypothetical protein